MPLQYERLRSDKVLDKLDALKAEIFLSVIQLMASSLSDKERAFLLKHPTYFFSKDFLFRGLSNNKIVEVKGTGMYPVTNGYMGSKAAFFSNSPFSAFNYIGDSSGGIAVLRRSEIVPSSEYGIVRVGSAQYHSLVESSRSRMIGVYEIDNQWDIESSAGLKVSQIRNIELRQEQPIDITEALITFGN